MKAIRFSFLAFVLVCFAQGIFAQNGRYTVTVSTMPTTLAEFEQLRDQVATTAEGGAAMTLIALKMYAVNSTVGIQCLVMQADRTLLQPSTGPYSYKSYELKPPLRVKIQQAIDRQKYLPNSYFPGATTTNGYRPSAAPWAFNFTSSLYNGQPAEGSMTLQVRCFGASTARTVHLGKTDRGIWKFSNLDGLLGAVTNPPSNAGDDL
jgi:hypothetical protein